MKMTNRKDPMMFHVHSSLHRSATTTNARGDKYRQGLSAFLVLVVGVLDECQPVFSVRENQKMSVELHDKELKQQKMPLTLFGSIFDWLLSAFLQGTDQQ